MTMTYLDILTKQNPKKGWLFLWDTWYFKLSSTDEMRFRNIWSAIQVYLDRVGFQSTHLYIGRRLATWMLKIIRKNVNNHHRSEVLGMKFYGWLTSFFFTKCSNIWDFSGCSMTHKKTDEWELRRIDTFRRFSAEPDTALDETEVWSDTSLELVSWGMRHWRKIWKFYVFYGWLKGLSAWMFYFGLPYIFDWRIQASWCYYTLLTLPVRGLQCQQHAEHFRSHVAWPRS